MACVRVDRRIARGDVGQGPGEPLRFSYQGRADALGPPYVRASVSVSAKRTAGMEVTRNVCTGIWSNPLSNQAAWRCLVLTIKPNPLAAAAELLDQGLGKRRMRVDATSTAPCRRVSSRRHLGALTQHSQRQRRRTRLQAPLCALAVRSGPMLLGRGQPEVVGRCGSQPGCPVGAGPATGGYGLGSPIARSGETGFRMWSEWRSSLLGSSAVDCLLAMERSHRALAQRQNECIHCLGHEARATDSDPDHQVPGAMNPVLTGAVAEAFLGWKNAEKRSRAGLGGAIQENCKRHYARICNKRRK